MLRLTGGKRRIVSEQTFTSRASRGLAFYGALLPSVIVVMTVVATDLPVWALLSVPALVGAAVLLAKRQVLEVTSQGVEYCNGLTTYRLTPEEVSTVSVRRPSGYFAWAGAGVSFGLARYPDRSRPVANGPVPLASVGLGEAERRRLALALTTLLGESKTEALAAWVGQPNV